MHYPGIVWIPMPYYGGRKRQMHPGLLLLSLKGLIFYKVFNTQQEEEESSRSFAFGYFLLLQQVPCDEAKQLNDKSPGRERGCFWC